MLGHTNKKKLASTWTPAIPLKNPDNIVSSDFTTAKVFVPSYEKTCEQCIEQLMTNEYQRIWWKEQEVWSKTFYANKNPPKRILCRGKTRNQTSQASMKTVDKCAAKCVKSQKKDETKVEKKCNKKG